MKSFAQYLKEKGRCWTGYKPVPGKKAFSKGSCKPVSEESKDSDFNPESRLGPKATKKQDAAEIVRQKKNLTQKTNEYHKMSKDEGGSGMAKAHGDMFDNAKKNIHSEDVVSEDGGAAGGAVGVGAVAGTGASTLPASQKEPGVSKKHNPVMRGLVRRNKPKM
jgi:hypothetical protein